MKKSELELIKSKFLDNHNKYRNHICVCTGSGCLSSKSDQIKAQIAQAVKDSQLDDEINVMPVGCHGLCSAAPLVMTKMAGQADSLYGHISDATGIASVINDVRLNKSITNLNIGNNYFSDQYRIVLENSGEIDPDSIEHYIARDGYKALEKSLFEMKPEDVVSEILKSGLRGRGGAGFPTGMKWSFMAKSQPKNGRKFVVCNGDEGDPGAFMDRSVMESDPHKIIEGMLIAAYAVHATEGVCYIRAEYPLAVERIERAIKQAYDKGLLGKNIFGTSFCFDMTVRLGAGAFVCGEETALIASVEGKRGSPVARPPFPTESGIWGCPTMINNVETLANIATILRKGADWFSSIGTEKSKGTKVFALAGHVKNAGIVEVPMGTSLRKIVMEIGGGCTDGLKFKAVQTGGPSGGFITEDQLDTPISYEHLQDLGSIMGSGGMIIFTEEDCMVDISRFYLRFSVDESCGKCAPCRVGGYQLLQILEKILKGKGTYDDLDTIDRICLAMQKASLCGLGQTAPNPVLSSIKHFRKEYLAYIEGGPKYARERAKSRS